MPLIYYVVVKHLFVQNGFTTNKTGIEWIKRELANQFRIHETLLENNIAPTHLDAFATYVNISDLD